jgi:hypothetical protein
MTQAVAPAPTSPTPTASAPPRTGSLCSISLDLDNLWSYMKTHGDAGWEAFPTYLDACADVVLDSLRRHGLRITIFVVGQDAALDKNREALRRLAGDGHEIGNHSFHHEPWLHLYSPQELDREIAQAEEHIERATGQRPRGFRGPGFSFSAELLRVLRRRGYAYDASTFPTFLGPLARAYYFWSTRGMDAVERAKRSKLFGSAREGLRPLKPYCWELEDGPLLEIPVTTMPLLRAPFHLSYLIYLARFSRSLMHAYLRLALACCQSAGVEPSFLLHPLDLLGNDRVKELAFFPGMSLDTERKVQIFDEVMSCLKRCYTLASMDVHAAALEARGGLRRLRPEAPAARGGSTT